MPRRNTRESTLRSRPWIIGLITMLAFSGARVIASPVYVLYVHTPLLNQRSSARAWNGELRFFNSGSSDATVSVLHVSNGVSLPAPPPLTIAPGEMQRGPLVGWFPPVTPEGPQLLVLELDAPDGVVVTDRIYSQFADSCNGEIPCTVPLINEGAVGLPVYTELRPAGQLQVLPAADLGDLVRRVNVTLYNGGATLATATTTVRSACDNHVGGSFTTVVPPDTVLQARVPDAFLPLPCGESGGVGPAYLTVVMDQPGFAASATIANQEDLTVPFAVGSATAP
jgi:hypothetical protein